MPRLTWKTPSNSLPDCISTLMVFPTREVTVCISLGRVEVRVIFRQFTENGDTLLDTEHRNP